MIRRLATLVALLVGSGVPASGAERVDLRSHELVRLDCASGEHSRNVSLFANGTVRIRDKGVENPGIQLAELEPDELQAFRNRFAEIDLSEVRRAIRGPSGERLEQCLLRLELESEVVEEFRIVRMAALALPLSQALAVIDDIVVVAESRERNASGLPRDYAPRAGDVLVKRDGSRHRIARITADGAGVEIVALESPMVVYMALESVRGEFMAVERRRGERR